MFRTDVDDPEICHDHSEIPKEWPPLDEILDYSYRVRSRIIASVQSGRAMDDPKLGRSLWLAYEHEAMHLETFLYMLLQSSRVLPPPGKAIPDFEELSRSAKERREANEWHHIPGSEIGVGMNDPENNLPPTRFFGWDNERPARRVKVPEFLAHSRCISNGEYAKFLEDTEAKNVPAAWTSVPKAERKFEMSQANDDSGIASPDFINGKALRTVYGPIALELVLDWPVMASYNELAAYAIWANARIPTYEEAQSIYQYVENQEKMKAEQVQSTLISAVNG